MNPEENKKELEVFSKFCGLNRCLTCGKLQDGLSGIYQPDYVCEKCQTIIRAGRQCGKTETQTILMKEKFDKMLQLPKSNANVPTLPAAPVRKFETGAIRDSEEGKEDYIETISWTAFRRYAQFMTGKKVRYGSGNFKKGIEISSYERSLVRHLVKYLSNKHEAADLEKNDDHLCAMLFNIFGIIHEEERIKNNNKEKDALQQL